MEINSNDPKLTETGRDELDLRTYYLGTLFDISKDIFGTLDAEAILRNFLLMTMGNFGVVEGFILIIHLHTKETVHFISNGFHNIDLSKLEVSAKEILRKREISHPAVEEINSTQPGILPEEVACAVPFNIDKNRAGMLGLGAKIIASPYTEEEKKLLITLVNSLIIALQNATAFEEINQLNTDLLEKSRQLEKTVIELKIAMKKVAKYSKHLEQIIAALNVAQEVQQSLLPQSPPKEKRLDIAGSSLYCDETGGDYYDYNCPALFGFRCLRHRGGRCQRSRYFIGAAHLSQRPGDPGGHGGRDCQRRQPAGLRRHPRNLSIHDPVLSGD